MLTLVALIEAGLQTLQFSLFLAETLLAEAGVAASAINVKDPCSILHVNTESKLVLSPGGGGSAVKRRDSAAALGVLLQSLRPLASLPSPNYASSQEDLGICSLSLSFALHLSPNSEHETGKPGCFHYLLISIRSPMSDVPHNRSYVVFEKEDKGRCLSCQLFLSEQFLSGFLTPSPARARSARDAKDGLSNRYDFFPKISNGSKCA